MLKIRFISVGQTTDHGIQRRTSPYSRHELVFTCLVAVTTSRDYFTTEHCTARRLRCAIITCPAQGAVILRRIESSTLRHVVVG